jgi:predicted DsbA family dithiol-disulfide isomerase
MRIDIWSDVVCPWCYLGKRRLDTALADFAHAEDVEVVFHSFQLDPSAPTEPTETATQMLARRYKMSPQEAAQAQGQVIGLAEAEGMRWEHERSLHLNTRAAHRLLHLALEEGVQAELEEALFDAYFGRAENVADPAVLLRLATEAGLDARRVEEVLASREYDDAVDADVRQAAAYGANGVPFFVVDGRYGISGAQPTELFAQALQQAWETRETK